MELVFFLVGGLIAAVLLVTAVLDLIAAVGGTLPGDRTHVQDFIVGLLILVLLRRFIGQRQQDEPVSDDDRVPLESNLPPER